MNYGLPSLELLRILGIFQLSSSSHPAVEHRFVHFYFTNLTILAEDFLICVDGTIFVITRCCEADVWNRNSLSIFFGWASTADLAAIL
jgi:hypothetical protein